MAGKESRVGNRGKMNSKKEVDLKSPDASERISDLFRNAPILAEITFRRSGTSSDYYLCQTEDEFAELLNRLPDRQEFYLTCVDDLELRHFATKVRR